MTIPQKLLKKWEVLRSPGDAAKMAEKMKEGYPEIFNRAFREKRCNDDVFKIMSAFYDEKAALIREYL